MKIQKIRLFIRVLYIISYGEYKDRNSLHKVRLRPNRNSINVWKILIVSRRLIIICRQIYIGTNPIIMIRMSSIRDWIRFSSMTYSKNCDFGNLPKNVLLLKYVTSMAIKYMHVFFGFPRDYRFIRYTKITACRENMDITIQIKPQIYANTKMANISKMLFMVAIITFPLSNEVGMFFLILTTKNIYNTVRNSVHNQDILTKRIYV